MFSSASLIEDNALLLLLILLCAEAVHGTCKFRKPQDLDVPLMRNAKVLVIIGCNPSKVTVEMSVMSHLWAVITLNVSVKQV